ncbi:helix-turn-helix domain-containing protein [Sporolactobacillus putidus]|uniref:XRE family transcriptional regulator n=1 Tax=Sporolactobacillus putidus TaxID=492735 RepID=A0A917W348_9BACL|nr:helix-turn-helix transcriptional regulator [Sporolactobacillus putidus]GGL58073.1 XRE family transcriptional regulator [Sporolactobacillus putidus]
MKFNVGKRIKDIRLEHGLKAVDLADTLKVSKGYLSKVESNKTGVSLETLETICEAIGITLAQFFQTDLKPVDMSVLEAISGLSEEKKKQLALFINGLSDKP